MNTRERDNDGINVKNEGMSIWDIQESESEFNYVLSARGFDPSDESDYDSDSDDLEEQSWDEDEDDEDADEEDEEDY